MNKKTTKITESNQQLDKIILESFAHNPFPNRQKAVLKEIRKRRGL